MKCFVEGNNQSSRDNVLPLKLMMLKVNITQYLSYCTDIDVIVFLLLHAF